MTRNNRCGACSHMRIGCTSRCVCAPYFRHNGARRDYRRIHKVFGNRNVRDMLRGTPIQDRQMVVDSLKQEALNRLNDPILGSYGIIRSLQQQIRQYEVTMQNMQIEINNLRGYVDFLTTRATPHENISTLNNALLPNQAIPFNDAGPSRILPSNLPVGCDSSFTFGGNPAFQGSTFEVGSSSRQQNYQDPNLMGFNSSGPISTQGHIHSQGIGQQVQHGDDELSPLISSFIAPDVISFPYTGPM